MYFTCEWEKLSKHILFVQNKIILLYIRSMQKKQRKKNQTFDVTLNIYIHSGVCFCVFHVHHMTYFPVKQLISVEGKFRHVELGLCRIWLEHPNVPALAQCPHKKDEMMVISFGCKGTIKQNGLANIVEWVNKTNICYIQSAFGYLHGFIYGKHWTINWWPLSWYYFLCVNDRQK